LSLQSILIFGKFAGEKEHWQVAKQNNWKHSPARSPERWGSPQSGTVGAGIEGMLVPMLPTWPDALAKVFLLVALRRQNEPDRHETNCHVQAR